jgi:cell division protein FtsI (penicillin-binding protein 3)
MNSVKRIKFVKFVFTTAFLGIALYVIVLQTVYYKKYKALADIQHGIKVPLIAERGKILDAQKRPLAFNQLCASIVILPQYVRSIDSVANVLASYNLKSRPDIVNDIKNNTAFFWFKKYIDYGITEKLKKDLVRNKISNSVVVTDDTRRVYPFGPSVGSVVGFLGDERGRAGLEYAFDTILRGTSGWILLQKDAIGNNYYWPSYPMNPPINGNDIVLTLDLDIQEIAYKNLAKYVDSFQALRGSVLVIDAQDASILAMCDYPDFDPQDHNKYPADLWKATPICDEFEPGSVYKLLICATALESENKDLLLSQIYDVSKGFLVISGKKIKDVHNNGKIDFDNIFIKSSNMGVSMLSQSLSPDDFYSVERRFGLGLPTGIDLPGEANGYVDRPQFLTQLRFANNAFGQGVRATLLQLSMAYLAIANDGLLLKPYIIKEMIKDGNIIYQGEKKIVRQVLDQTIALQIKEILARAVSEGTGRAAQLDDYLVCGKTGTAQKIEPDGKYSSKKSMMTFIGFFPKESPKYLIAVYIDEPKISRFAGEVTCPLFKTIATRILRLQKPQGDNSAIVHENTRTQVKI